MRIRVGSSAGILWLSCALVQMTAVFGGAAYAGQHCSCAHAHEGPCLSATGVYGYVPVQWRRWPSNDQAGVTPLWKHSDHEAWPSPPASSAGPEPLGPSPTSPDQLFEDEMPGQPRTPAPRGNVPQPAPGQPNLTPPRENPFKDDPTTPGAKTGATEATPTGSVPARRWTTETGDKQVSTHPWQFNPLAARPKPISNGDPTVDEPWTPSFKAHAVQPAAAANVAAVGANPLRAAHLESRSPSEEAFEPAVAAAAEAAADNFSEPALLPGDSQATPIRQSDSVATLAGDDGAPAPGPELASGWSHEPQAARSKVVDKSTGRFRWRKGTAEEESLQPASLQHVAEPGPALSGAANPLRRGTPIEPANPLRARW